MTADDISQARTVLNSLLQRRSARACVDSVRRDTWPLEQYRLRAAGRRWVTEFTAFLRGMRRRKSAYYQKDLDTVFETNPYYYLGKQARLTGALDAVLMSDDNAPLEL